jgi:hypothetical protein
VNLPLTFAYVPFSGPRPRCPNPAVFVKNPKILEYEFVSKKHGRERACGHRHARDDTRGQGKGRAPGVGAEPPQKRGGVVGADRGRASACNNSVLHPSLTRTVVNPVVSARQPARATAPTATDSVRVFFAIRFRIAPPSQSTSAGRAGLSLGAVLRAFATTSLEPRSLASLLPSTLACSSGFIGQAVTCGLWGFSRRSYGPVGTPAETPQRLDEGCSIWTPLVWEGASRYSGPRLPGLCVVLP